MMKSIIRLQQIGCRFSSPHRGFMEIKEMVFRDSLKMILNLSKISNRPKRRGTSSMSAQARRIFSFFLFIIRDASLIRYGTPPPETPLISRILSSGPCLKPSACPNPRGIIVRSAPESIYNNASILAVSVSMIMSAIGRLMYPKGDASL